MRLVIRSRVGNAVLAVLGAIYFVSASVTLVFYVVQNWGANGLTDYVLQGALVAAAIGGVFFFRIGTGNLKPARKADGRSTAPMSAHPAS